MFILFRGFELYCMRGTHSNFYAIVIGLIVGLCVWVNPVHAQRLQSIEDFPHTDSFQATQDDNGFVWFSSLDGLCRFDGLELKVYKTNFKDPGSLINNRVTAVAFDKVYNGLWLGTGGGGINFFDIVTERFIHYTLPHNAETVSAVLLDSQRRLWVVTDKGVVVAALKKDEAVAEAVFREVENSPMGEVACIFEDHQQRIYFTSGSGVYKVAAKTPKSYTLARFLPNDIKFCNVIRELEAGESYYLLIGCADGLYKFDFQTGELTKIRNYTVISLLINKEEKTIWVGTPEHGLDIIMEEDLLSGNLGPVRNRFNTGHIEIRYIFKDSFNTVFLCTTGQGVKYFNSYNQKFNAYPDAQSNWDDLNRQATCFSAAEPDKLWIGTKGKGLALFDRKTNHYRFFLTGASVSNRSNIGALFHDKDKNLWIGGIIGGGLYYLSPEEQQKAEKGRQDILFQKLEGYISPIGRINKIKQDKNGMIWLLTQKGVALLKDKQEVRVVQKNGQPRLLYDEIVNDLVLMDDAATGRFTAWIGTRKGIYRLLIDYSGDSYKLLDKEHYDINSNLINSNWVSVLLKNKEGNLVVGTLGGGISIISRKDGKYQAQHVTKASGLVSDEVETIIEDSSGDLWIGSLGLTRFNPKENKFNYYDVNDGLQSNFFKVWAAHKINEEELVFGGIDGFNIFAPRQIVGNPVPPRLMFTELILDNKRIHVRESIEGRVVLDKSLLYTERVMLYPGIKTFTVEFAGVHTQSSNKELYRYRLEGFDKEWAYTNSSRRMVSYSNLSPGTYTLWIEAHSGDGVWSEQPKRIEIVVKPTFWQSGYGYLFYFLVFLALVYAYTRYTILRTNTKNELALQQYKQERELKSYDEKLQFFTNISHELRTPLALITTPLEQVFDKYKLNEQVKEKLGVVYKNASRLKILINQLLDIRKFELGKVELNVEKTDLSFFVKQIFSQFEDLASSKGITWKIKGNDPDIFCEFDRNKIDQVFLNLFSNALKFTPEGSEVEVDIQKVDQQAYVTVRNTNSYIEPSVQKKIFDPFYQIDNGAETVGSGLGLAIVKYLVELHSGQITVESQPDSQQHGAFTAFTLSFPCLEIVENIAQQPTQEKKGNIEPGKRKLVIAEDNTDLRHILIDDLQDSYEVFACDNGKEALALVKKHQPDLVIADVMMPLMDGISLIKAMKRHKYLSHIPVIIISAKGSDESKIEGLETMANDYIEKPFNLKILNLKIRNLISSKDSVSDIVHVQEQLSPSVVEVPAYTDEIFKSVMADIEKNIDNHAYTVADLCDNVNLSRSKLFRIIKSNSGLSINGLILDVRLNRAAQLLTQDRYSVNEVMYQVGFENASYFNRAFKKKFGDTPRKYAQSKGSE